MAEGNIHVFNNAGKHFGNANMDWDTNTWKLMLMAAAYVPNIDTQEFLSDISANEAANANYARATLTCSAPVVDTVNNWVEFDAADVLFTALGAGNLAAWVAFKDTGTPATSPLLCYGEIVGTQPNGGNYTVVFHADGVFKAVCGP